MNERLPVEFLERIKEQLGDEYPDFLESYDIKGRRGIRINELKTTANEIREQAPFSMEPVPWVSSGYFIDENDDPAGHPFYKAGLYYIQEPSAMTPADRLDVTPGEKVLDLCAAPGGKATALAVKLKGEGLLVANDASASRCKALLHNLELFGAGNIVVTNEQPFKLEKKFPEFFDKILVDAPCSGEGMFRKEPEVIGSWTPERVEYFSSLQKSIVKSAVAMLKDGGMMLYSTCTFSKEENEGTVSYILDEFPEMKLIDIRQYDGFAPGKPEWGNGNPDIRKTVRIWPHKMEGAGHYLALFKKEGSALSKEELTPKKDRKKNVSDKYNNTFNKEERDVMDGFLELLNCEMDKSMLENRGGKVYMMPFDRSIASGIKFLRCGLYMGELKKKRFEPSQALALWTGAANFKNSLDIDVNDDRVSRYFNGETTFVKEDEDCENGTILIKISGKPVGFGKKVNGMIKNKYVFLR